MKGFVATVEGIVALSLFITILLLIPFFFPFPSARNDAYTKALSMDVLTYFEEAGLLQVPDRNGMRDVLRLLPDSVCMEIAIESATQNGSMVVKRPGCETVGDDIDDIFVTYRSFYDGNTTRIAVARSWTK
jgi:hypothetical protein